jgi:membrane carboxypeptidase/penicillin-binding protein
MGVVGKYFQKNRSQLKNTLTLPKNLVQALVARRRAFFEHSGIEEITITCKPWNKWWSKYFNTATSQTIIPW